ncbi:MAG: DedA family protein [Leptospiraceae bacterium]|nr:DedA family protein [Leptospiraceae bacterium]
MSVHKLQRLIQEILELLDLFILTFLAGSILPFPSETFLLYLLKKAYYPVPVLMVIAVAGNSLGAFLNYYLGRKGAYYLLRKIYRLDDKDIEKNISYFKKYGGLITFFSFVPVVGDPLTVIAGILKYPFLKFSLFVVTGKTIRFLILTGMFVKFS